MLATERMGGTGISRVAVYGTLLALSAFLFLAAMETLHPHSRVSGSGHPVTLARRAVPDASTAPKTALTGSLSPAYWQSRQQRDNVGADPAVRAAMPGCHNAPDDTCWLPSVSDGPSTMLVTIYAMDYCGYSKQAASTLMRAAKWRNGQPRIVGRVFWGSPDAMDPPISLLPRDARLQLGRHCAGPAACGFDPQQYLTWPLVFINGKFIGGAREFLSWCSESACEG